MEWVLSRIGFLNTNPNLLIVPLLKDLFTKVDRLLGTVLAMDNRLKRMENETIEYRRNETTSATSEQVHKFQDQSQVLLTNINKKLKKQCRDLEFLSAKAMLGEEEITEFSIHTIEEMDEQRKLITCDPVHKQKLVITIFLCYFL